MPNESGSQSGLTVMDTGAYASLFTSKLISPLSLIKGPRIEYILQYGETSYSETKRMGKNGPTTIKIGEKTITLPTTYVTTAYVIDSPKLSIVGMDILQHAKIFLHHSGLIELQFEQ